MYKYKYVLSIIILSIFLISCQESTDENLLCTNNNELFTINNGVLIFKDNCAFEETMYLLNSKSENEIKDWEREIGFTNSYRKFCEENQETITIEDEIISDPSFAAVINREGFFGIGDTIHKLTMDTEYVFSKKLLKKQQRRNFEASDEKDLENNGIKEFKIDRGRKDNLKSISGSHTEEVNAPCGCGSISAHLNYWCTNTLVYASIGIKITGRKRSGCSGTFVNSPMYYAKVEGTSWCLLNGKSGNPDWGENDGSNQTSVSKTLAWVILNYLTLDSIRAQYTYEVREDQTCSGCMDPCSQVYNRFWK